MGCAAAAVNAYMYRILAAARLPIQRPNKLHASLLGDKAHNLLKDGLIVRLQAELLPPKANFAIGHIGKRVYILHGRNDDMRKLAQFAKLLKEDDFLAGGERKKLTSRKVLADSSVVECTRPVPPVGIRNRLQQLLDSHPPYFFASFEHTSTIFGS